MKELNKLYCNPEKLTVRPVNKSVAKDIIVNNHYSGIWTKVSYALGLFYTSDDQHQFFSGVNEKLIGIACYGDPIGRHSGASISEQLDRTEVLELTRLFVFDGYGSNIESWFVGQSFKWLKENAPHIRALISYSDPSKGHLGQIYQATNWIYQKNIKTNTSFSFKWEEDGKWQHERTIAPYYGTISPAKIQTIISKPFWVRVEPHKHRYIYILGTDKKDRKQLLKSLKHPNYPYPKILNQYEEKIIKLEPVERSK